PAAAVSRMPLGNLTHAPAPSHPEIRTQDRRTASGRDPMSPRRRPGARRPPPELSVVPMSSIQLAPRRLTLIPLIALLALAPDPLAAQIGALRGAAARLGSRLPDVSGLLSGKAPITTSLSDAKWAVDS